MKKIIIILGCLVFALSLAASAFAVAPEDLVGWWRFENTAEDSSTYSNDGSLEAEASFSTEQFKLGDYSLKLDGTDDYFSVPNSGSLNPTGQITVEVWFWANEGTLNYQKSLVQKPYTTHTSPYYQYGLFIMDINPNHPKKAAFWLNIGTGNNYIGASNLNFDYNEWHHLAGTYDGSVMKLYLDGAEVASKAITGAINSYDTVVQIGSYPNLVKTPTYNFGGFIDDVRIWSTAKTPNELSYNDYDMDGVLNDEDLCPDTDVDPVWDVDWGTNRWEVQADNNILGWYQNRPGKKGARIATFEHEIDYTYGCNGHQILEMLNTELGNVMNGHRKFGLSSSVLEDFHMDMNDGVLDGRYYIETVTVNSGLTTNESANSYPAGMNLCFESQGVYSYGPALADTEWQWRNSAGVWGPAGWISGDLTPAPWTHGLDVVINDTGFDWVGTYPGPSVTNLYTLNYTTAVDGYLNFKVLDDYYGDNRGSLTVKIYADIP